MVGGKMKKEVEERGKNMKEEVEDGRKKMAEEVKDGKSMEEEEMKHGKEVENSKEVESVAKDMDVEDVPDQMMTTSHAAVVGGTSKGAMDG